MHIHLFSSSPFEYSIVILLISITISTCYGQEDEKFYDCSNHNYSCGQNIQGIGYPFWGDGRPQFCGHREFELKCQNGEYPTIDINYRAFRVLGIDQTTHRITVARLDLWDSYCIQEYINFTLNSNLFSYGPAVRDLFVFYGCTSNISRQFPNNLTCTIEGRASDVFYVDESFLRVQPQNVTSLFNLTAISCNMSIKVPVLRTALDRLSNVSSTLQVALNQGFELLYDAENVACLRCNDSGGICGSRSSNGEFLCLCGDHGHPQICQNHEAGGKRINLRVMIAIIVFSTIGAATLVTGAYLIRRKTSSHKSIFFWRKPMMADYDVQAFLKVNGSLAPKRYSYSSIKKVTNSFQDKLGQGGYGNVYKGKLVNGHLVAVKLLNETKGNGEEFINEVASISRTSHVNVVSLLGYCSEGSKRALIYEYMPNGSLDKFIYSKKTQQTNSDLEWNILHKIAVGVARGLEYLHRGCGTRIFHFDIKPHNILLDEDFCPKISDFGLAKLCPKKESIVSMMCARGTIGYIAPEVLSRHFGRVSHKADVYSYGMLLLEMVGVRQNNGEHVENSSEIYFPHSIYKKLERDVDLGLCGIKSVEDEKVARKMIFVGLWCIQARPSDRPAMSKVIEMLEGDLESLQVPPEPFLSSPSRSLITSSTIQISEDKESCEIE